MNLSNPLLFVGLGGTGIAVGLELERWLRDGVCGPTGTDFLQLLGAADAAEYQPHQLPRTLQFIYVDLDEDDMRRVRDGSDVERMNRWPVSEEFGGIQTYSQAASYLRAQSRDVSWWVPGPEGEPMVSPLTAGAGQVPMAGRVAMFQGMVRTEGPARIQKALTRALGSIYGAGAEASALGGSPQSKINVFLAFSVAGGMGCGVFYDYLHLLSDVLYSEAGANFEVYPLVLMPSAFEDTLPGEQRRNAQLNAAPALIDLFRLVDHQNGIEGLEGEFSLHYPDAGRVRAVSIPQSTIKTAVLFGGASALTLQDIRRSMVAFIVSMVGAHPGVELEGTTDSFASQFVNSAYERATPSLSGVGHRGVSAAITASLRAPVEIVADLVSGQLLTTAISSLGSSPTENNDKLVRDFMNAAGLQVLLDRPVADLGQFDRAQRRARNVSAQLADRRQAMIEELKRLELSLPAVLEPVARFNYLQATRAIGSSVDPYRLARVIFGSSVGQGTLTRLGVKGVLTQIMSPPHDARYEDGSPMAESPPAIPALSDSLLGIRPLDWNSDEVVAYAAKLQAWFEWRRKVVWGKAWAGQYQTWSRALERLQSFVSRLQDSFTTFSQNEAGRYRDQCARLLQPVQGVALHLPPSGPGQSFDHFIGQVCSRYSDLYGVTNDPLAIVEHVLSPKGWSEAIVVAHSSPTIDAGLQYVRDKLAQAMKATFVAHDASRADDKPVWPPLSSLLYDLSQDQAPASDPRYGQLTQELAGVIPTGFEPQGAGALKVLVAYPGSLNEQVRALLSRTLNLPPVENIDYRPTGGESLEVTMFRSEMGVADQPEVARLVGYFLDVSSRPTKRDYLPWRRRFPSHGGEFLAFHDDQVRLVHQLLNLLWDGRVEVNSGEFDSPKAIVLRPADGIDSPGLHLELKPYGRTSSWYSFVTAYEAAALSSDLVARQVLRRFNEYSPDAARLGAEEGPTQQYKEFMELADGQRSEALRTVEELPESSKHIGEQVLRFWSDVVPAAVDLGFPGQPFRANHRELAKVWGLQWPMRTH